MASPRFAIRSQESGVRSQEKELIFCQHLAVGFRRFPSISVST
ncbi:hypothetical protein [Sphaerospermopsis aphanizomenoides]|nr:hypothetical protein [Sphaerospermopsis aphanizomenoides]